MRARPLLALALVPALLGGVALAAPKPVCNQVTDPAGDLTAPSDNLDIISADIASSARKLTAVVRVKKLAAADGTAPTGVAYNFRFTVPGKDLPYYLLASFEPSPVGATTYEYGTIETGNSLTPIGTATGKVDLAANTVTISAPLKFGSAALKAGGSITGLQAVTQRRFVVLLAGADTTVIDASRSYRLGAPTCVKDA